MLFSDYIQNSTTGTAAVSSLKQSTLVMSIKPPQVLLAKGGTNNRRTAMSTFSTASLLTEVLAQRKTIVEILTTFSLSPIYYFVQQPIPKCLGKRVT